MSVLPNVASVAALVGDPTRGRMLIALMDGRALTATELALEGGVTPSTASSHLTRLTRAGLVSQVSQGRHRYFRIAAAEVATALEGLMSISARPIRPQPRTGPLDERLRQARICYDHLAGRAAVRLLTRFRERNFIRGGDAVLELTESGEKWCAGIGIDVADLRAKRRQLCRSCLDWSERKTHLAGALGAAILDRLLKLGYVRRERIGRAVIVSPRGEAFIEQLE